MKTAGNNVTIEAKHEERQDEHGFVSRHFVRRYALPPSHDVFNITSSLSSDGVLTITAPKKVRKRSSGGPTNPKEDSSVAVSQLILSTFVAFFSKPFYLFFFFCCCSVFFLCGFVFLVLSVYDSLIPMIRFGRGGSFREDGVPTIYLDQTTSLL